MDINLEAKWCILCGQRFEVGEPVEVTDACPGCGTTSLPCSPDQDFILQVNWHELRVLTMWAERWAQRYSSEDLNMPQVVAAIARRLQNQVGNNVLPLTFAQEAFELTTKYENVHSSVPDPPAIPINGPGAVGFAQEPITPT